LQLGIKGWIGGFFFIKGQGGLRKKMTGEFAGMAPVPAPSFKLNLYTKNFLTFSLSFYGIFPIVLSGKNGYN